MQNKTKAAINAAFVFVVCQTPDLRRADFPPMFNTALTQCFNPYSGAHAGCSTCLPVIFLLRKFELFNEVKHHHSAPFISHSHIFKFLAPLLVLCMAWKSPTTLYRISCSCSNTRSQSTIHIIQPAYTTTAIPEVDVTVQVSHFHIPTSSHFHIQ